MKKILLLLVPLLIALGGCELTEVEDGANVSELQMSVTGLKALPDTLTYTAWILKYDQTKQINVGYLIDPITVDAQGSATITSKYISFESLQSATGVLLTAEQKTRFIYASQAEEDSLRNVMRPSSRKILTGAFGSNSTDLSVNNVISNLSTISGVVTILTPTDGNSDQNESSGIWFADSIDRADGPLAGLNIQDANDGWSYYAWIETNGTMLQIGGFTKAGGSDDFAGYSDIAAAGLGFPGEDFLTNAPAGVTFPLDLSGAKVIVTAQPDFIAEPQDYVRLMEADIPSSITRGTQVQLNVVYVDNSPSGSANIVIQH